MGAHSRTKGRRAEQQVINAARAVGLRAERTWHLAQHPDPTERVKDVQIAQDAFERVYRELAGVRGFIFRRDRGEWLVALRASDYLELLKQATTSRAPDTFSGCRAKRQKLSAK